MKPNLWLQRFGLPLWLAAWACALMQEFAGREAGLFFKNPLKVSEIVESAGAAGSAATARSFNTPKFLL
jgi:hypothetical protein